MPGARVRMRGLHEMPLERLLFIVVLGCSVLLLSVVMLRSEEAAGVTQAAPRTLFRDGFIVAQQNDARRTESNGNGTTAVAVLSTGNSEEKVVISEEKKTGTGTGTGTQVEVEHQGEHTMTKIKTEDGDEITIKRAANSKKITTISAHEDGKITIENRKEGEENEATKKPTSLSLRTVEREPLKEVKEDTEEGDDGMTRRVGYEKISIGKEKPQVSLEDVDLLGDELQLRRIEADDIVAKENDEEDPVTKMTKKVTVVEVGRTLTKVSVQDAPSPIEVSAIGNGQEQ